MDGVAGDILFIPSSRAEVVDVDRVESERFCRPWLREKATLRVYIRRMARLAEEAYRQDRYAKWDGREWRITGVPLVTAPKEGRTFCEINLEYKGPHPDH